MCHYVRLFGDRNMTAVYCFSGTGHSMAVAELFRDRLNCRLYAIGRDPAAAPEETAVIVFPVYCQNIPDPVKCFLPTVKAKNVVLVATYGRVSWGNVLWQAQRYLQGQVIAGAYVPANHSYLDADVTFDPEPLLPIMERIRQPRPIQIPRSRKNPFADFFPAWRSRLGVKLTCTDECNHCNLCGGSCPMDAMKNGVPNSRCIRCLRCVTVCPQGALQAQNRWVLKRYLAGRQRRDTVVYL